jgi:hypothetical protein
MTTIIKMAREAGFERVVEDCPRTGIKTVEIYAPDSLERFAALVAAAEREAFPDLSAVINWLENGCDPQEAAKELRLYAAAIRARGNT